MGNRILVVRQLRGDGLVKHKSKHKPKKVPFGVKVPKKVKSPTGHPSKKSAAVKKAEKGDFKVIKLKKKKGFTKGTIPRVEKALKDAGG